MMSRSQSTPEHHQQPTRFPGPDTCSVGAPVQCKHTLDYQCLLGPTCNTSTPSVTRGWSCRSVPGGNTSRSGSRSSTSTANLLLLLLLLLAAVTPASPFSCASTCCTLAFRRLTRAWRGCGAADVCCCWSGCDNCSHAAASCSRGS